MAPAKPKLWKLEDLMEYLGYSTAESTVKAILDEGIPHFILGGKLALGERGAGKLLRCVPSAVEEWALGRLHRSADDGQASAEDRPRGRGRGDWKKALGPARPTGPRGE